MAIVIKRGKYWHIQWYDPIKGRTNSKSTGLIADNSNKRKAEDFAEKLQTELTKQNMKLNNGSFRNLTIIGVFEHFLRVNQDRHPKTIYDYKRFFKKFSERFNENESCLVINKLSVEEWLLDLRKLKLSKNSIHGYGKQCNHFLNFLFEYEYIPFFKINRSVKTRPEVKEKIVFKETHINSIINNLEGKNNNFRTAILLLLYTGLRSSDILTLTVESIDLKERVMSYYSPKRKKYRTVPFHHNLIPVLSSRISEIKSGKLLDYHCVENLGRAVTRYFEQIGLNGFNYTARTFRKTFITLCRNKFEMDDSIVKELVGHEHGSTTDRYYNSISLETMKKELRKFDIKEFS